MLQFDHGQRWEHLQGTQPHPGQLLTPTHIQHLQLMHGGESQQGAIAQAVAIAKGEGVEGGEGGKAGDGVSGGVGDVAAPLQVELSELCEACARWLCGMDL